MPFSLLTAVKIIFGVAFLAFTMLFIVACFASSGYAGVAVLLLGYVLVSTCLYFGYLDARQGAINKLRRDPEYDAYTKHHKDNEADVY